MTFGESGTSQGLSRSLSGGQALDGRVTWIVGYICRGSHVLPVSSSATLVETCNHTSIIVQKHTCKGNSK